MDRAVCRTRLATTRCSVFSTDASNPQIARNRAQTPLLGPRLSSKRLFLDSDDDQADSSAADKEGQCMQPVLAARPPTYTDVARQFQPTDNVTLG